MQYFNFKVSELVPFAGADSQLFPIVFRSAFSQGSKPSYIELKLASLIRRRIIMGRWNFGMMGLADWIILQKMQIHRFS